MVKIEIDDVYRKPSNFFQLKIVSCGKIFKVPSDAYGSYDRDFSIYDKETGGTLACSDFGRKWEEVKLTHSVLKSFIQKRFSLALQSNGYVSHKKNKLHNSYVAYSSSKEIQIADRDICKFFDGFEYRIISLEDVYYVCINPHLKIRTEASIKDMVAKGLSPERLSNLPAEYIGSDGRNKRCNIIGLKNGSVY
ncbi:MAG: hypothetical protein H7A34_01810 [bacterium]|nr:hypothetical protein [bacterium]